MSLDILTKLTLENERIVAALTPEEADELFGFHETEMM